MRDNDSRRVAWTHNYVNNITESMRVDTGHQRFCASSMAQVEQEACRWLICRTPMWLCDCAIGLLEEE